MDWVLAEVVEIDIVLVKISDMSESSLRLGLEKELRLRRSRRVIIIDDERETVSCALLANVSPSVTDFSESS